MAVVNPVPESVGLLDLMRMQQQLDANMILNKLIQLEEIDLNIVGEPHKVLNQELMTEYSNKKMTQWMVKGETWRKSVQEVCHYKDINSEKLVGYMNTQVILKMKSHRRKGSQEIINGLKHEQAGTEVIPSNIRKKKFFGLI